MYVETVDFGPTIRLVPHSGIQFVEYAFNIDALSFRPRSFIERPTGRGEDEYDLVTAWSEGNAASFSDVSDRLGDRKYAIDIRMALEIFLEKWVPVPVLRVKSRAGGVEALDHGPTNWARVRVVEAPERAAESDVSHRVIFAFDTELLERHPNAPYTAPSVEDAANDHEFQFAHAFADIAWFLGAPIPGEMGAVLAGTQDWVPAWLLEMFHEFKQAANPDRPLRESDFRFALEHYARYLTFLDLLARAVRPRTIRLVDTVSANPVTKPVWVDLVLDIGNSRTCGILIESHPNEDAVDLNNSLILALRDLSLPERSYTEPFESHIEFSEARFGRRHLSVRSSRSRAFFWPSPVRVGPEAARFRQGAQGNEASTGLSSPKRYLCDTRAVNQEWRFPQQDYAADGTSPLIDRALRQFVNLKGDVIEQLELDGRRYGFPISPDDRLGATRLSFSRSSLFTFMVAEVICHALSMINNPAVRERRRTKDAPRRLRRIITTLPPAISVQEQRLLRSRAEGALKLLWKLMGWWDDPPPGLVLPEVHVNWDEASCVQFVYLYGEITQKLGGSTDSFMKLLGKNRPFADTDKKPAPGAVPEPSVRIASIDIGGGTSDLMITTYYAEGRAIKPTQNFREGFRTAGDDILKGVVERLILPVIEEHLRECGHPDARGFLLERFGGDRANMAEQEKHLRRQFVLRVLEPISLQMLGVSERGQENVGPPEPIPFADFFGAAGKLNHAHTLPSRRIIEFLDAPAHAQGASRFALADCVFEYDAGVIAYVVQSVLDHVVDNMCEAVNEFDCDVLILSGRPTRLPEVVDLVINKLAIRPERVIPLHLYQAGNWFPFRSRDNRRIGDPKTTTAVGGMLCALAESQVTNFTFFTNRLGLRSTAKYIGEMESDGRLLNSKLLFRNLDLDQKIHKGAEQRASILYYAPMRLGYRQLPLERWIASPLYRLRLKAGLDVAQLARPLEVVIERSDDTAFDDEAPESLLRNESMKEEFYVSTAFDAKGIDVTRKMELVLNTLEGDQGYWLDTGILSIG